MALFGLGTLPLMLSLSWSGKWLTGWLRNKSRFVMPVVMTFMGTLVDTVVGVGGGRIIIIITGLACTEGSGSTRWTFIVEIHGNIIIVDGRVGGIILKLDVSIILTAVLHTHV